MSVQRIARRYAQALLDSAITMNQLEVIESDIKVLARAGASSSELRAALRNPAINSTKKMNLVKEIFEASVSPLMMNFLNLLIHKNRMMYYADVIRELGVLYDRHRRVTRVDVTSAFELDPAERTRIVSQLEQRTGMTVVVRYHIDASLIGGISVKIGDTVLDSTIHGQLERLRATMLN